MDEPVRLDDNGHQSPEDIAPAEQEDLEAVYKKLSDLKRNDGALLSLTKQDLSLLKTLIHAPEKGDDFIRIAMICDFLDETEANDELDAFYEAIRLGMETNYNIAHALTRSSINRKGAHRSSRVAVLLDTMSHQKFTSNQPRTNDRSTNPRSPLA